MKKGYIYIMTNPSFSDKVKIGFTCNVEKRKKQLSNTNVPDDFEVYATYETSGNLEDKKLHRLIDNLNPDLRYNSKKEFYVMSPEDAYELLEAIATISGTLEKLKRIKMPDSSKKETKKRPAINFTKCGIPIGAKLVFTEDPSIVCTVESDRKVRYKDEITSLSAVAKVFLGKKTSEGVRGPHYFTYEGELVSDIARRTQWKNDG